eukprot:TRINITY_DN21882_c0_g1_i2.p1 TRINITY_DN21882_c0_g1~~TRINITY_DN21882_c0_g1_i2.p1  ORF type:complete len:346 (+),score=51.00 TRINITY_DN21882_c0_g1_i2:113-1150(+)
MSAEIAYEAMLLRDEPEVAQEHPSEARGLKVTDDYRSVPSEPYTAEAVEQNFATKYNMGGAAAAMNPEAYDVMSFQTVLPKWAYVEEVAQLASLPQFEGKAVPMGLCVGPAVLYGKLCILMHIIGDSSLFFLAYHNSTCTRVGVAEYATWLWLAALPMFLIVGGLGWQCCRYTMIPYLQVCRSFRLLGKETNFCAWMVWAMVLSILNVMDNITDCFFTATAIRTDTCEGDVLVEVWTAIMEQSVFRFLGPYLQYARYDMFVLIVWMLTFLQFLVPLLNSQPTRGEAPVDYVVAFPRQGEATAHQKIQFTNIFGKQGINLGNVMYHLAESTGNAFLQTHQPWYDKQ